MRRPVATNAWGVTHPSLPNYLAMVSGRTGGVTRTCTPAQCPQRQQERRQPAVAGHRHQPAAVISPTTVSGTRSATRFDHYSLLKTTQRLLGIRPLLGHAADDRTRSVRPAFGL